MKRVDFLVLGSGIAGLSFALKVAPHGRVAIVTKKQRAESNTNYAQGGIASVWAADDSFEAHVEDTLTAGAGLCHRDLVELVVREGPARIRDLIALGTHFSRRDQHDDPEYDLGQEGGHSHRRILHASDATGREIMRALVAAVRAEPNIQVLERHLAIDLLSDAEIAPCAPAVSCWGAYVLSRISGFELKDEPRQSLREGIVQFASHTLTFIRDGKVFDPIGILC
jgi:L-aspartate oxidase